MTDEERNAWELDVRRRVQSCMPRDRLRIAKRFTIEWRQHEARGRWFLLDANGATVGRFFSPENAAIGALELDPSLTLDDIAAK
jgi:hypothetical protein